jgi:hypothetical protein
MTTKNRKAVDSLKKRKRNRARFPRLNTGRECRRENHGIQNYGVQVPEPQKTP